jgi:DNA invertase Pin-like site-specific DNA recombinase
LTAQLKACRAYASKLGIKETAHYSDSGISGSKEIAKRPGLTEAIACLNKGDYFIVAKLDRIARELLISISVQQMVAKRGCKLVSVAGEGSQSTGIDGLIQSTIVQLFAQVERESIRQRTRHALDVKRQRGERIGTVPYGYKLARGGVKLIPCDSEIEVIKKVHRLRRNGRSYREIVKRLNKDGIPTRTGSPWCVTQIVRILKKNADATKAKTSA